MGECLVAGWRASDGPRYLSPGSCLALEREVAEAYNLHPGHGARWIDEVLVEYDCWNVLDLGGYRSPSAVWKRLGCVLGELGGERECLDQCSYIWEAWERHPGVLECLSRAYRWVRYEDVYPGSAGKNAVSWAWLGPGLMPVATLARYAARPRLRAVRHSGDLAAGPDLLVGPSPAVS